MAVELNWSKTSHNNGNFIYYIFRSEHADFEPSANNQIAQYDIITNNSYVDEDITIGKTYYYKGNWLRCRSQSPKLSIKSIKNFHSRLKVKILHYKSGGFLLIPNLGKK